MLRGAHCKRAWVIVLNIRSGLYSQIIVAAKERFKAAI